MNFTNLVPDEYRQVVCPYCKHPQNMINIEKRMYTQTEWSTHTCDKCRKLFGYVQIVERAYITAGLKVESISKDERK